MTRLLLAGAAKLRGPHFWSKEEAGCGIHGVRCQMRAQPDSEAVRPQSRVRANGRSPARRRQIQHRSDPHDDGMSGTMKPAVRKTSISSKSSVSTYIALLRDMLWCLSSDLSSSVYGGAPRASSALGKRSPTRMLGHPRSSRCRFIATQPKI
jgi:hypothetical protein